MSSLLCIGFFLILPMMSLGIEKSQAKTRSTAIQSPSFRSLQECFPEIPAAEMNKGVSLNSLKAKLDQKYPSLKSIRILYVVDFRDAKGQKKRVKWRILGRIQKNQWKDENKSNLTLYEVRRDGSEFEVPIPSSHQEHPTEEILNSYLISALEKTETSEFVEEKIEGVLATYKKAGGEFNQMQIQKGKVFLECETSGGKTTICSCLKRKN